MVAPMHCLLDGQRELIKGLGPVVLATIGVLRPRLGDEGEDARDLIGRLAGGLPPTGGGRSRDGVGPCHAASCSHSDPRDPRFAGMRSILQNSQGPTPASI